MKLNSEGLEKVQCEHDWFDCSNSVVQAPARSCKKCGWTVGANESNGLYIQWPGVRSALPPVDGLEVVGWEHKLTGIIRQRGDKPSLGVADGDYEELCHLSQASSVIAGLRSERITAERDALDAYGKLQAADALQSLRAQGGVRVLEEAARNASMYLRTGFIECDRCGHEVQTANTDAQYELDAALSSLEASPAPVSEEWLDPSTAPKDGTIVRLLVKPDMEAFTSLQDSEDAFETIGFNHSDESGEDTWHFAGWDWAHDCITQGHGEVIGWAAFSSLAALAAKGGQ